MTMVKMKRPSGFRCCTYNYVRF